ncbi:MAG: hypothetical protein QOC77_958 [Thermoleophilaceae bacterium]|nr:hypothetical protein [Thermoleophilaceae bacterium]
MELTNAVLARAAEIERSYHAPVLAMRVESTLDRVQILERVLAAIATLAGTDAIHWSVDDEPAGVIVRQWGHAADIGATLLDLSRALDSEGVDGELVVHAPEPRPARTPLRERPEELLECHVRVRGERRFAQIASNRPEPVVRFFPDDAAMLAGMEAALAWVGDPPAGAELWSRGDLPHRDVGEVRAHIAASLRDLRGPLSRMPTNAWWESGDRFRLVYVAPASGDVSFVEGGPRLAAGGWEEPYSMLVEELSAASAWGSYGLIKRGREPGQVGRSVGQDWVPFLRSGRYDFTYSFYEDVLAPDAFGAQLLGSGYAGRVPEGADWERVDVGHEAALLLHRDPAAWFGEPLPPITILASGHPDPAYPTPEVILRAREDLAGILVSPDAIAGTPLDPLRR